MQITDEQIKLVNDRIRALVAAESFYGKKLEEAGITEIHSAEDFAKLPSRKKRTSVTLTLWDL